MERRASEVRLEMQRGLPSLASIAAVAPFFGFFGTVVGIMGSFVTFGTSRSTIMAFVAGHVSQALAPTLLGLFVALLAYSFHRYLDLQLQTFDLESKCTGIDLLNQLRLYLHRLRIADPTLGAALSKPIGRSSTLKQLTTQPQPPRLRFRLERIYRHGLIELVWPKLQSPFDPLVLAETGGGLCVVYGIVSLLAFSLYGRSLSGFVLFGFFSLAGYGVAARRWQGLLSIYVFLMLAASFCLIAYDASFLSFCSVSAAFPLLGAWKALDAQTVRPRERSLGRTFYSLGLALVTLSAILTAAIGTVIVSSTTRSNDISMQPTILPGDRLFGLSRPLSGAVNRNDLWAVNIGTYRSGPARVIGLPGDDIQVRVGKLVLNGVPVEEPYTTVFTDPVGDFPLPSEAYAEYYRPYHQRAFGEGMTVEAVYRVPSGHYFVMNDNRQVLWDSRLLGPVPRDQLVVKFLIRWGSANHLFGAPHLLYSSK